MFPVKPRRIRISRDGSWLVRTRQGFFGPVAVVSRSASTQRVFTTLFTVPRAVRYARNAARQDGLELYGQ